MQQLQVKDFPNWTEYYWTYQYVLAKDYYLPLFAGQNIFMTGKRILDVGCGHGGFTAALADAGAQCVGVEIKPFDWKPHANVTFMAIDITQANIEQKIGKNFDMVILRDVIEHIPIEQKRPFLQAIKRLTKPGGLLLTTFPPFYSPFGLHQQTLLTSRLKRIPFLSWLPKTALRALCRLFGEEEKNIALVFEIADCRMPIYRFKRLTKELNLVPRLQVFHLVRPSHEIRYGMKTRLSPFAPIPLLNEVLVSGCAYLLAWKNG